MTVASRLHVTHWHLARVLRRTTGHSFLQHLHHRRIVAASHLLVAATAPLSIKEIAYDVGYSNTRELDRRFRKATGMCPSEFRKFFGELS
jgi:AraC-like DNA-binding protein